MVAVVLYPACDDKLTPYTREPARVGLVLRRTVSVVVVSGARRLRLDPRPRQQPPEPETTLLRGQSHTGVFVPHRANVHGITKRCSLPSQRYVTCRPSSHPPPGPVFVIVVKISPRGSPRSQSLGTR